MTLSRTATTASTATSVSATAVTTSTMFDFPLAKACVCASELRPASPTAPNATLSNEAKLPPALPVPAPTPGALASACEDRWPDARCWRRRWRQRAVRPWVNPSGFENIEGTLDHAPGGADDVDVGLIGTLGLAHVGHFHQRIDVGIFDVAVFVGGGMARLVFQPELGIVDPCFAELDQFHVERAIDFGLERRHLAPIGLCAGGRRR